ncbi:amidohydrolase [Thermovibrio guaymasensis]|uniref:Amidohydrolase n=1 Tax=Thermovibrio guaymasensis TaxID=240167 RepID=A0A420W647_9BACT|nr:M20 family metallopeptidase [Thermovibrio guaymasensis]RKQ60587.1 amidohydrolase [Thermovibrio guaymasensis]
MENLKDEVLKLSEDIKGEVIEWRRHIHMYPELSGREFNTSEFVADKLKEFGVDEVLENFAGSTAVIGLIKGKKEGPTVALRADMDALPTEEKTGKPYASKIKGVMHSCGHDAHTAMLLGTAKVLCQLREKVHGNVKLIFQPCEERHDCKGAKWLVENGVLENPKVSAIFGLHVFPDLPTGYVGTKPGPFLASSDVFRVKIKGRSTHASRPHQGIDPVLISAQAVTSLHHVVSRYVDPLEPAVLTIGKIEGGFAENVIPDEVRFEGTVRALSNEVRENFPKLINRTLKGVSEAYGGNYEFEFEEGTPPLINDEKVTLFVIGKMRELLGEERVIILDRPTMGGEDFSVYLQYVPGTFIRLGSRNEEKGTVYPLHNSRFDVDEDALPVGVAVESYLALQWLITHS